MSTTVSADEAEAHFPDLLGKAANGETVVITRDGKPVAQLVPCGPKPTDEERQRAWDRLLASLEVGLPLGGEKFDRESLYDDR